MEEPDFEYQGVEEITCPWCGESQGESWESKSDHEDAEKCVECGKLFAWQRDVQVTYDSFRGDES
jgi:hypothetical protein